MREIGQRIGAIRNADHGTVYVFGFWTYEGDEVPPEDVRGPFGRVGLFGIENPKFVMDSGVVVWGCESWWGPDDKTRKMIGDRVIEYVEPERTPATDEERREAAEIMEEAKKAADEIIADGRL